MKHQKTANRAEPVMRDGIPIPTLEQVREVVELAWTDASNLPEQRGLTELCADLQNAATNLDMMIERAKKLSVPKGERGGK